MKKYLGLLLILTLVFSVFVPGCSSNKTAPQTSAPKADTIKIGVFEPMTGDKAQGGQMTVEGIKLANKLYPEVMGKKVELVILDNKSDKNEAGNAVARLIDNDKVNAIIGSYGSGLSMAAGPIAKEKKIPVVGCSPTNPLVTKDNEYYFRVCFIDPFQGTVMARYAVENLQAKTAVVIPTASDDYSVGLCSYFKDSFIKLTNNPNAILSTVEYTKGTQDFTAQLTSISKLKPDVIFAPGDYGDGALLIKQARELGIKVPILGGDTWEAPDFIKIGGKDVEGTALSTHYSADNPITDTSKTFIAEFKKEYNKDTNAFAALGFDAYLVILDSIKRGNSAEPAAIRDNLAKTAGFKGATGIITINQDRDATKSAVILKVQEGKFVYQATVNPK